MQPFNYTINTGGANEAFQQGMNQTAGLMATAADFQKSQAMIVAAQQKAEADAYKRQRFQSVSQNPNSKDVQSLLLEFPELHEGLGKSLDFMSADEKKNTQAMAFSVLSALENGKDDAAVQVIDQQIDAAKNAKDTASAKRLEVLRNSVIANPNAARFSLDGLLFSTMGKDYGDLRKNTEAAKTDAATRGSKVRQGEAEATKTEADAVTAQVKAKFADSDAAIELEKKGWDIKKIQSDMQIAKMNSQIAAMNAQTSRMNVGVASQGNNLKMQENQIKLQELIDKRNTTVREKAAEVESARFNIDNMLNTANRVLNTPKSVISAAAGPISSRIPTTSSNTADFEALVSTLGSQAFLSQLPNIKGMGQLSNVEGDKLQAALQNMSLTQSPGRLIENVKEAQRLLLKVRQNVSTRYGVPDTAPDTPAAPAQQTKQADNIDALLKKYGQ
jgi:hypothetical protein